MFESLKLVRCIRDEVHRFGITFHRLKRSKGTFTNELERIPGIGKQTAEELLRKFRSVSNIKELTARELGAVLGMVKARKVWDYFHAGEEDPGHEPDEAAPPGRGSGDHPRPGA